MGSSSPSSTTQRQEIDPWLKDQISGNLETIQGLQPYQPTPVDEAFSPIVPSLGRTLAQQKAMGDQGAGMIGKGAQTLQGVANYNPSQVSAGQADIGQFMNPYTDQVVNQSLQDLDRSRQMAVGQTEDQALASGAFGGARHGVADAETNRAFADRAGALSGQLRSQGFGQALGAAQNQQQMEMGAQQANQGAGLDASRLNLLGGQGLMGAGQSLFGLGQGAGQFEQNLEQAKRDFQLQEQQQAFQDPRTLAQMETAAIQGIPFMGTTTQTQPGGSRLGGAIGGGLSGAGMGAQIGTAFGGPGIGTAIGGGLGLLGGMFG